MSKATHYWEGNNFNGKPFCVALREDGVMFTRTEEYYGSTRTAGKWTPRTAVPFTPGKKLKIDYVTLNAGDASKIRLPHEPMLKKTSKTPVMDAARRFLTKHNAQVA